MPVSDMYHVKKTKETRIFVYILRVENKHLVGILLLLAFEGSLKDSPVAFPTCVRIVRVLNTYVLVYRVYTYRYKYVPGTGMY